MMKCIQCRQRSVPTKQNNSIIHHEIQFENNYRKCTFDFWSLTYAILHKFWSLYKLFTHKFENVKITNGMLSAK